MEGSVSYDMLLKPREVEKTWVGKQKKNSVIDRKINFFSLKNSSLETIFPQDGFDRVIVRCIKIQKCQRVHVSVHAQFWKQKVGGQ